MNIEPYPSDVACAGPTAPKADRIDDLIRLLVTISERWGNTCVRYRVQWGANGLWAADAQRQEIERLKASNKRLRAKLKKTRALK